MGRHGNPVKKVWANYGQFRHLEPKASEFLSDQESKLDDRDGWIAVTEGGPCGGEEANADEHDRKHNT
jgi:hypothetical protein